MRLDSFAGATIGQPAKVHESRHAGQTVRSARLPRKISLFSLYSRIQAECRSGRQAQGCIGQNSANSAS